MKKFLITMVAALAMTFAAQAQPRSLGVILGYNANISYQHQLGGENFIEANLGTFGFDALNVSATYNFMIAQPAWTSRGEWGFYAGPGVTVGTGFSDGYAFSVGVGAQVGLEYTFWFPLQLALDLRPQFGIYMGEGGVGFFEDGATWGFIPSLSVRYRF